MKKLRNMFLLMAITAAVSACGGKQEGAAGEEASGSPGQESQDQSVEAGQEGQDRSAEAGGQESGDQAGENHDQDALAEELLGENPLQESENTFTDLNEFQAAALDGSAFTQEDFAERDVTAINFWALSCGPCIAEMPDLAELEKALPDNVQLITVCLDGSGNEELVEYVLDKSGFEGITLLSGDGDLLTLSGELRYTPTTVFADSEGNMVGDVIIGGRENLAESYLQSINSILTDMGKAEISVETDSK